MKGPAALLALFAFVASVPLVAQPPPQLPPPCTPADNVVCGQQAPEDLVALGSRWVAAGAYSGTGGVVLIRASDRVAHTAYPSSSAVNRPDARTYPDCPGPPGEGGAQFTTHGVYVAPGNGPVHKLFVVGHGARESIEVFDVDAAATPPSLTWVGCAPALSTQTFNAVVALPEGGFAATNTRAGDVWEYHTKTGWRRVPGTEKTAPNGLEISKDGRWFYIAGWAEEKVTRVSRGRSPVQRDVIALGFRPDNIRFSADSSLLFAAGHTDKDGRSIVEPREVLKETINVARIDPTTLEYRRIFEHKALAGFVAATTAVPIGDELWLGSNRGDRVAYFPLPK